MLRLRRSQFVLFEKRLPPAPRACRSPLHRYQQSRTIFNTFGDLFQGSGDSERENGNQYHERKILPYRQSQLYNIVADVESYHRFVPYCVTSRVLGRNTVKSSTQDLPDILKMRGELTVGFMGYEESYISNVECRPYEMVQAIASSEIPLFKSLITTWRFQPASSASPHPTANVEATLHRQPPDEEATLVTLDIEYEFANLIYGQLSKAFFSQVSKMMVAAFEQRCLEVYGPGTK
ncbi:hypothetical protein M422DRAFT_238783 [Sphaerobolus stellatus SS14]|nr:hypothetical protein M422DRAFT_238783 [Sphaerobolus stellatus SS14]